jgi:hypothetical protein
MSELVEVSGVVYEVADGIAIAAWVRKMASKEWEPDDLDKWGQDLLTPHWCVQVVPVATITMRPELLASEQFQTELLGRVAIQIGLIRDRTPIPPLVLRGGDLFLFDGYARTHALRALGVAQCLAYVSQ